MARNSNVNFEYSSTTGATAAQNFAGGSAAVATYGVFAASTTIVLEMSFDGTNWIPVEDILGNDVTDTVNGATGTSHFTVSLPTCQLRINVSAGTMTSGNTYVCANSASA